MGKPTARSNVATYTKKELAGYLTGLAGQNIIYNIIATGLAFYFQSVIFLPAMACSLIFALARVWDAINDPMMGTIVDKTRTKWGKCKPYLLFVPGVVLITTILPFINSMYAEPKAETDRLAALPGYTVAAEADPEVLDTFTYTGDLTFIDKLQKKTSEQIDVAIISIPKTESVMVFQKDKKGEYHIADDNTQKSVLSEYVKENPDAAFANMPAAVKLTTAEVDAIEKTELASYTHDKKDYILYQVVTNNRVGVAKVVTAENGAKTYVDFEDDGVRETMLQGYKSERGFIKAEGGKAVLIIIWAAFSYVLWGMTYTIGDIPLWGVTSLMTEDQNDRAKALTLARAVANVGMIGTMFTMIAPAFQGMWKARGMDEAHSLRAAYITLAVVMTVFATVLFQFAGISVKERVAPQNEKTYTIKENFKIMFGNKPFRQILISGILRSPIQLLGIVAMTLVMYYFFNNDIGKTLFVDGALNLSLVLKVLILVVGLFGGMIVFPLFVPNLITKHEKKSMYNFFTLIGAIPFALIFVVFLIFKGDILNWPGMIIMAVLFFMAGASMGSLNVLQSVMIADCVDYEEYNNGIRPDGVFFSGQSFITKLSAGIASLISGAVYAIVGFSDKNVALLNNALVNGSEFKADYPSFAMAMFFLISIPPAIGMVLAAIPTLKYALTDKEHTRMLDELNAQRNNEETGAEE